MTLQIDEKHYELIKAYGQESYPLECCGFLFGVQLNGQKQVCATMPALNSRSESHQHNRFLIQPQLFLENERFARKRGMEIIGFYHSHPNAEAIPSDYDREHAWPWYSYVIVPVHREKAGDLASWSLRDDRREFEREEIVIVENKGE